MAYPIRPTRGAYVARTSRVLLLALAAVSTALIATRRAFAQQPAEAAGAEGGANDAARRQLIEMAQQASRGGDAARALELANRAGQIEMSPSLRLFIARQQLQLGRVADAYGNADRCSREAEAGTAIRNRAQLIRQCRELATQLSPRLARVVVRTPSPAPQGLAINVGESVLLPAFYGIPYPVSPGRVRVHASAEGFLPFERVIELREGASGEVTIDLRPAPRAEPPPDPGPAQSTNVGSGAGSNSGLPSVETPPPPRRGPGAGPWVLVGVGGAAAITGAVFYGLTAAELSSCPERMCPDQATVERARTFETVAIAGLAGGGALVAAGILWFALAPRGPARSPDRVVTSRLVQPEVGPGHAGLRVFVAF